MFLSLNLMFLFVSNDEECLYSAFPVINTEALTTVSAPDGEKNRFRQVTASLPEECTFKTSVITLRTGYSSGRTERSKLHVQ
jgi:hypothetical protein